MFMEVIIYVLKSSITPSKKCSKQLVRKICSLLLILYQMHSRKRKVRSGYGDDKQLCHLSHRP